MQQTDRRNAENLAEVIKGATPRTLQRFLTESPWADQPVVDQAQSHIGLRQPERGFHRLKGAALAIRPLLLRSDQRICGLVRILVIALRALTLLEFVARRCQLAQQPTPLQGLYAGNPKRATQKPTAERLLRAFDDLTWYQVSDGQTTWAQVTPLSDLQRRILDLLGIPETVYTRLAQPILASPPL